MKSLILHIGMPKTGTTSIQTYLRNLKSDEMLVPALAPFGLTGIMYVCATGASRTSYARRTGARGDWNRRRLAVLDQLADSDSVKTVISTELLYEINQKSVDILRDSLEKIYSHISIILYLREQSSHLTSLVSQRVKSGASNWDKILSLPDAYYN